MATATALGPENSKNVSIYANGDSITLAPHVSILRANCARQNHLHEKPWLINRLGIVLGFRVGYKDLIEEAGRGKCARQTDRKIPGVCFIKGLQIRLVS
jgi:hypothetical protein